MRSIKNIQDQKISIILPTYNEKGGIGLLINEILRQLQDYDLEVIVVDDNSPDGTAIHVDQTYASEPRVRCISNTYPKGLAYSIRCGLESATGDIITIMDSDFNHHPKYLPFMIANIEFYPVVLGSRFQYGGGMQSHSRNLLSWIFNIFTRVMLKGMITDSLYGFLCIRRSTLKNLDYDKVFWGFGDYCIRLLYYLQQNHVPVLQFPVKNHDRVAGTGNSAFFKVFVEYTVAVFQLFFKERIFSERGNQMYSEIKECRICGNSNLETVIDLGNQALTGVFPSEKSEDVPSSPLELIRCSGKDNSCGLVQLRHAHDKNQMFGERYGYRSGLNASMVKHLQEKVRGIEAKVKWQEGDIVLDIGSNDGTLLKSYRAPGFVTRVGMDPTIAKFGKYYDSEIKKVADFFSAPRFLQETKGHKAKVITSIAMFYDLDAPMDFMRQVKEALAADGLWICEQSYLATMLEKCSYDTICHEHLEYYHLKPIQWMAERLGLKIIDVQFNGANGGSFELTFCHQDSDLYSVADSVGQALEKEKSYQLEARETYLDFQKNVHNHREHLISTLKSLKANKELVIGLGASTKGNVILQYCNIDEELLPFIAEVNQDKFGCFTPGTLIPIISEEEAHKKSPHCLMPLPWHFRDFFISKEETYLDQGGKLLFPLPTVESFEREGRVL